MKKFYSEIVDTWNPIWAYTNPFAWIFFILVMLIVFPLIGLRMLWHRSWAGQYYGYVFKLPKMSYEKLKGLHELTYPIMEKNKEATWITKRLIQITRIKTWRLMKEKKKQ